MKLFKDNKDHLNMLTNSFSSKIKGGHFFIFTLIIFYLFWGNLLNKMLLIFQLGVNWLGCYNIPGFKLICSNKQNFALQLHFIFPFYINREDKTKL